VPLVWEASWKVDRTTWRKQSDPPISAELVPVMAQDVASPERA